MARKLNDHSGVPGSGAHSSALRISVWDEGAPHPNGWFRVKITHRRSDYSLGQARVELPLYPIQSEPGDASTQPQ